MLILNIHSGISDNDIINWINKNNLLENKDEKINEILTPKIWVFFDEINTCNSMGLISEILCKHSMQGKKLKSNVIFIAACNPYRKNSQNLKKNEFIGLIKKDNIYKKRNLVYTVNPLPFSLINFVFDFGNLTSIDEEKYIKCILSVTLKNKKNYGKNLKLGTQLIKTCQNKIRDFNDISSVSLREIRRFVILYEWFLDFLQKNNKIINENEIEYDKLQEHSLVLSTYITYYIRIYDKNERKSLGEELNKILGYEFTKYPIFLSKFILDKFEIEPGIAKNKSLLENVFTLFVCVNNLIPVFICGKPGCSKSLSVQLIFKSMKGEDTNNEFFKKLPTLYQYDFQGSLNSTSKGVLSIFEKARNFIKNKDEKKTISLVYFDEMGLAEISKNNPLKVIHSQLEYDENETKVAFIGISNWTLDASKMNRGIHLSIPEPDLEDLKFTAKTIVESYDNFLLTEYGSLFEKLAISYYNYKEFLKELGFNNKNNTQYYDFHGSRDFYHLIKITAKKILKYKRENRYINKEDIALESIERNFGGLDFSVQEFKKIFLETNEVSDKYDIKKIL